MKELIPKDNYGIFADIHDTVRVDSLYVAQMFNKRHDDVLKSIRNLDCSEEFRLRNFAESSYLNQQGKKQPCYAMTRDGFTFLVMGYRGKKAARFKEAYIRRFNQMETFIRTLVATRKDYPLLTENIKLLHENPKPHHFSNECDLINRLVTGMTAKEFRKARGVKPGASIRPYLDEEQIWLMNTLQKADIGLLISEPNYEARKRHLEWYKTKLLAQKAGRAS
ncbi:MAG: Rha family transcriptional regulator [Oscillospiraceae bacterium]|nr:Rha family transcriptional regulator [Oscillospiraceae bacterium]